MTFESNTGASIGHQRQAMLYVALMLLVSLLWPRTAEGQNSNKAGDNSNAATDAAEVVATLEEFGAIRRRDDMGRILAARLDLWIRDIDRPLDFSRLPMLEEIQLHGTDLVADDLTRLGDFATVKKLSVNGRQFTVDAAHYLKTLSQLTELTLEGTSIDDNSLLLLARCLDSKTCPFRIQQSPTPVSRI